MKTYHPLQGRQVRRKRASIRTLDLCPKKRVGSVAINNARKNPCIRKRKSGIEKTTRTGPPKSGFQENQMGLNRQSASEAVTCSTVHQGIPARLKFTGFFGSDTKSEEPTTKKRKTTDVHALEESMDKVLEEAMAQFFYQFLQLQVGQTSEYESFICVANEDDRKACPKTKKFPKIRRCEALHPNTKIPPRTRPPGRASTSALSIHLIDMYEVLRLRGGVGGTNSGMLDKQEGAEPRCLARWRDEGWMEEKAPPVGLSAPGGSSKRAVHGYTAKIPRRGNSVATTSG
ncbi:hypothetical protein B0H17DRAFT_1133168 [Mycena rosella]|uniref:Uncharacterized protein n=1 Tax=Mycena rosella TaxID=1033263 RepID=A0AAD7GIH0_MYCRO|nr:hypothetical protein B0H17DRAFT_1133168 [Mycena rosella]